MFILGVGSACPDTVLSNEDLVSLGLRLTTEEQHFLDRSGVVSRKVSLPLAYIAETKNADVVVGRSHATISATALAVKAVHQALERAGISLEQVGLLLADSSTPDQTCPSEAQRVGGLLGVKIPAYDVVAGAGTLSHYIEMLSSWKPERVPDYVLCVSTNTPSQHVNYAGAALPAYLFGDAAFAMVLSTRQPGKARVATSFLRMDVRGPSAVVVEKYVSVATHQLPSTEELKEQVAAGLSTLAAQADFSAASTLLVGPQLFGSDISSFAPTLGIGSANVVSGSRETGYAMSASSGSALSSLWDGLSLGQNVAILHSGDGLFSGSLLVVS
jgi:3-oxoacyl-[acyl-carrier-protein] synthase III